VLRTRRPGRIKLVHPEKLGRPRDVIKLRETDEYAAEYSRVWHVLGEEFAART
jgi:NitT/TauT family transport system ATP-binding protein